MCVSELPIPCPSSQLLFIYIDFGLKNICCNAQFRAPPGIDKLSYSTAAATLPSKIMLRQRSTAIGGGVEGGRASSPGGRHSACWPALAKISVDTHTITDIHTNGP